MDRGKEISQIRNRVLFFPAIAQKTVHNPTNFVFLPFSVSHLINEFIIGQTRKILLI